MFSLINIWLIEKKDYLNIFCLLGSKIFGGFYLENGNLLLNF